MRMTKISAWFHTGTACTSISEISVMFLSMTMLIYSLAHVYLLLFVALYTFGRNLNTVILSFGQKPGGSGRVELI